MQKLLSGNIIEKNKLLHHHLAKLVLSTPVAVDVGTHSRASLREKILAKTGAKRAFFDQKSGCLNSYK